MLKSSLMMTNFGPDGTKYTKSIILKFSKVSNQFMLSDTEHLDHSGVAKPAPPAAAHLSLRLTLPYSSVHR